MLIFSLGMKSVEAEDDRVVLNVVGFVTFVQDINFLPLIRSTYPYGTTK